MKKFPVTVIDNFYENPDLIKEFALSQKFTPSEDGRWPGERSEEVCNLNHNLFKTFCDKLFSLFYNFEKSKVTWYVETQFQKINRFSEDRNSVFNRGWVHSDPGVFSGVVYLSHDNCGTNIYTPKKDVDYLDLEQKEKFILYSGQKIDEEEYSKRLLDNNNKFDESIKVRGEFNRLILFEGGAFHGVPSFYTEKEPRLTQVFFVKKLELEGDNYPIIRSRLR